MSNDNKSSDHGFPPGWKLSDNGVRKVRHGNVLLDLWVRDGIVSGYNREFDERIDPIPVDVLRYLLGLTKDDPAEVEDPLRIDTMGWMSDARYGIIINVSLDGMHRADESDAGLLEIEEKLFDRIESAIASLKAKRAIR